MGESRAAKGVDDYGLARSRTGRTLGLPASLSWKMRSVWPGPSQISRGGSEPNRWADARSLDDSRLVQPSASGTKRTNGARLMMSVVRNGPDIANGRTVAKKVAPNP